MEDSIRWLVEMGIAKDIDGYSESKKNILELLEKETLTDDEKIDFIFNVNCFLSCV